MRSDLLPAELLNASGLVGASAIADVCAVCTLKKSWRWWWKGGRQIDLFKGKGNAQDCDASRGLLLADQMSKGPATILKRECDPHYCAHIRASQFGAVPGRRADMAHDIVDSVLQFKSAISLSVDRAVREAVKGYPSHIRSDLTSRRAHLENVVFPLVVQEILRMNDCRPPPLKEWAYQPRRRALFRHFILVLGSAMAIALRSLRHDQGCKLESTIFNVLHAEAPVRLQRLFDEGCMARVVCPNRPFDLESADIGSAIPIIDIVYVDDLTVLIVAASLASLWRALDALLMSLIELFSHLAFVINWNLGKTEIIMLKFRATGSVAEYERLQSDHGFGVPIQ